MTPEECAKARCVKCKHAEWERTKTGQIKRKRPGRCRAEISIPTALCISWGRPVIVNKIAIWPDYVGRCDLFEQIA